LKEVHLPRRGAGAGKGKDKVDKDK
jgi:hypothetical protein